MNSVNGTLILIRLGAAGAEKFVLAQTDLGFGFTRADVELSSKNDDFVINTQGKLSASLSFTSNAALNQNETTEVGYKYLLDSIQDMTKIEEFTIVQIDGLENKAPVPGSMIIKGKGYLNSVEGTFSGDSKASVSCAIMPTEKPDTSTVVPEP